MLAPRSHFWVGEWSFPRPRSFSKEKLLLSRAVCKCFKQAAAMGTACLRFGLSARAALALLGWRVEFSPSQKFFKRKRLLSRAVYKGFKFCFLLQTDFF